MMLQTHMSGCIWEIWSEDYTSSTMESMTFAALRNKTFVYASKYGLGDFYLGDPPYSFISAPRFDKTLRVSYFMVFVLKC